MWYKDKGRMRESWGREVRKVRKEVRGQRGEREGHEDRAVRWDKEGRGGGGSRRGG